MNSVPQMFLQMFDRKKLIQFLARFQSYLGLIMIFIVASILSPERDGENVFLAPRNLLNILRFSAENGIIAIGMTFVIITAGIDLSVGAILALCAVAGASFMVEFGYGTVPTILLVLLIGGVVGMVNGVITTSLKIQSFITTLAMLSIARGIAKLWAGGFAIPLSFGSESDQAPQAFKSMFAGEVGILGLKVPAQIFYLAGTGLIAYIVLRRTAFGRHVYAVGGNERAAQLAGVKVNRVKIAVFTIAGFLSALAALLHISLVNQGSPIDGNTYELNAIAAVVIGGTSLMGGRGFIGGTIVGAIILSIVDNILGLLNIESEYQAILKGIIIVIAVVMQRVKDGD